MIRRELLFAIAAVLAFGGLVAGNATAADKKTRVLFLTKSAGYEHSVVKRKDGARSHAENVLTELGRKNGFEVTCTKNGSVFLSDEITQYDTYVFYTTGDLTGPSKDGGDGMTVGGKARLLELVGEGKGLVGVHCASDSFHTKGEAWENQAEPDPFVAMLGGEFLSHGRQQTARMTVTSPNFPGLEKIDGGFDLHEEWYSLKNLAPDLHVILREEAYGMEGYQYMRPAFPSTWARMQGKGRVFYTAMGHREDVWTNPIFQSVLLGGIAWASREVDADVTPNIKAVTPYATVLPKPK